MVVSTFVVAATGTWVTERIVIPRLGEYTGDEKRTEIEQLSAADWRGLNVRGGLRWSFLEAWVAWGTVPPDGFLRNPETGSLLRSPFLSGIVAFIFLGGTAVGVAFGVGSGRFKNDKDVMNGMGKDHQHTGKLPRAGLLRRAVRGLLQLDQPGTDLRRQRCRGSSVVGARWYPVDAGLRRAVGVHQPLHGKRIRQVGRHGAPVFVPMFMLLGFTPELTQTAYRIGDSSSNIISPMMSYFALIVAFFERYDKKSGIGTVVATMLPYTVVFMDRLVGPAGPLDAARPARGPGGRTEALS